MSSVKEFANLSEQELDRIEVPYMLSMLIYDSPEGECIGEMRLFSFSTFSGTTSTAVT